ncbi:MAG: type II toxin-antitoxin system antitoxin SocA domain-containing protein ['Conium maculatum' witches'-broom phytoplasma]|nr:type II toxin-antitoxin system antitoxin SocA domain-containing protein ['Conium maculatum' witches'-broom phytoplasma]
MKNNNQQEINVYDVTNYLIHNIDTNKYQITNMKINKLLYYIQGHYVAKYEKPLFKEPIEAWMFGPVIPHIYGEFFDFVDQIIPRDYCCSQATNQSLSTEAKKIIQKVINEYARFSAYELSVKTHNENPWKISYNPRKQWKNNIITYTTLKDFFKSKLN